MPKNVSKSKPNCDQPEMYCKGCGALIPDNLDRRNMGESSKLPSLLACKSCAVAAGGKIPSARLPRMNRKEMQAAGQESFLATVEVIEIRRPHYGTNLP